MLSSNQTTSNQATTTMDYPIPKGVHAIPHEQLDLRPDAEIDHIIQHPTPVTGEKNVWFFWHAGFAKMHPYTQRNVRAWHRRFSKQGWVIRVMDRVTGSASNVANFLDINNPATFPRAFVDGRIGGDFAPQHTSDLVRFPLLLKYGGVYADAGFLQIGDLNRMWEVTVGDPASPYEMLAYNMDGPKKRALTNYFLCCGRNNPLFERSHRLLLALWNADGGRENTEGMRHSPLLKGVPLLEGGSPGFTENGKWFPPEEVDAMLSDYIVQSQAMTMVMGLIDEEDNWNGSEYVDQHVWAMDFMPGSQLINDLTEWNGPRAFELMSLSLPQAGEEESADQAKAREIVEACLSRSFGFKLAHGLIIRVMGDTLGSLWRKHEGSDDVPGTYAHWLREGIIHCCPDELPEKVEWEAIPPFKVGSLLGDAR